MNYYLAVSCLLALTASIKADDAWGGLGGVYAPGHSSANYYAYPKYAFEYAVKDPHTGDNKAQWEKRDGDVVKGAYSLVEPDGSLRVVEYWADDKSGFNAVVKRVGPNLHPTSVPVAPIYKAPIPMLGHGDAISPISIGSVAKYSGLAGAPLISGPIHGGAVSSANLYKAPAVSVASVTPILPAPIIKSAPILSKEPYYPGPILSAGPYLPAPIIKSAPLYSAPHYSYLPGPLIKSGPILSGPIGAPVWKDSISLAGLGAGHWDDLGLYGKGDLGLLGKGDLGWMGKGDLGWLGKGAPLLPSWNPHLDYSMGGFKH